MNCNLLGGLEKHHCRQLYIINILVPTNKKADESFLHATPQLWNKAFVLPFIFHRHICDLEGDVSMFQLIFKQWCAAFVQVAFHVLDLMVLPVDMNILKLAQAIWRAGLEVRPWPLDCQLLYIQRWLQVTWKENIVAWSSKDWQCRANDMGQIWKAETLGF